MTLKSFRHNRAGYRAVMRSKSVQQDLQRRADRVRAAAESQLPAGSGVELLADTTVGRNRAGGTVLGVPMRLEVAQRILGSAIDAAR